MRKWTSSLALSLQWKAHKRSMQECSGEPKEGTPGFPNGLRICKQRKWVVNGSQKDNTRYWTENFVERCSLKEPHIQRLRASKAYHWRLRLWSSCRGRQTKLWKLKGQVRFKGTDGQIVAGLQELQWLLLSRQKACFYKTSPCRRKADSIKTNLLPLSASHSF